MSTDERFQRLRAASALMFGPRGPWAYDPWAELNARFFEGALEPTGIVWALTPHGGCLGVTQGRLDMPAAITLHPSTLSPSSNAWKLGGALGERYAADVLLHEMMHQAVFQHGNRSGGTSSHNNEAWVSLVNRIAPAIGVQARACVVRQRRIDGKRKWAPPDGFLTLAEIARFPHTVRPAGFYGSHTP